MRAGRLRNRMQLERGTPSQDSAGEATRTWAAVTRLWASILPETGREFVAAKAERSDLTHLIEIRFRRDVVPTMRLTMGSRVFDIESARDPEDRRQTLHCSCRERLG